MPRGSSYKKAISAQSKTREFFSYESPYPIQPENHVCPSACSACLSHNQTSAVDMLATGGTARTEASLPRPAGSQRLGGSTGKSSNPQRARQHYRPLPNELETFLLQSILLCSRMSPKECVTLTETVLTLLREEYIEDTSANLVARQKIAAAVKHVMQAHTDNYVTELIGLHGKQLSQDQVATAKASTTTADRITSSSSKAGDMSAWEAGCRLAFRTWIIYRLQEM